MATIAPQTAADAVYTLQDDLRFAELAARTGLEPELARRCADDPAALLEEFGLSAAEPLYTGQSVVVEELDRADGLALVPPTLGCTVVPGPEPTPLPAAGPGAVGV
ncbi:MULTISPECIES: hypothetical protein [Streptomyces]|uniref:Uncharacterized protein n=1 Tax=Streptomyces fradiae TaxID=1906 RepID=A0ACC4WC86_STRFR|nr:MULTISPECIES: hypothetical protein [Streptomyces]KNE82228.1 hypothetical protein ADZ36_12015 [Streptomyces fradiae]OFA56467.1 hypothetical protein BEN35_05780 [Streptomyces fradiae]